MKSISSIAARGSWLANCLASWLAKWNPGRPVIALMWGFLPALATQLHSRAVTPTGSNTLTEQSVSLSGSFTPPGPAINTTGGSGQLIRPEIGGATVGLARLHVGSNGAAALTWSNMPKGVGILSEKVAVRWPTLKRDMLACLWELYKGELSQIVPARNHTLLKWLSMFQISACWF